MSRKKEEEEIEDFSTEEEDEDFLTEKSAPDPVVVKLKTLESKPWYRLIKVVYFGGVILIAFGLLAILWSEKPYKAINNDLSYVKCNRDAGIDWVYNLSKNNWSQYGESETLDYYTDQNVRKACNWVLDEDGSPTKLVISTNNFLPLNYTFHPVYETVGSYSDLIFNGIVGAAIFIFIVRLIAEIFFYVVTGKALFKDIEYYR